MGEVAATSNNLQIPYGAPNRAMTLTAYPNANILVSHLHSISEMIVSLFST
jgi:hypothetical protein